MKKYMKPTLAVVELRTDNLLNFTSTNDAVGASIQFGRTRYSIYDEEEDF